MKPANSKLLPKGYKTIVNSNGRLWKPCENCDKLTRKIVVYRNKDHCWKCYQKLKTTMARLVPYVAEKKGKKKS